ncbi:hypothetical protein ACLOJK_011537 [Asimina triloba]
MEGCRFLSLPGRRGSHPAAALRFQLRQMGPSGGGSHRVDGGKKYFSLENDDGPCQLELGGGGMALHTHTAEMCCVLLVRDGFWQCQ